MKNKRVLLGMSGGVDSSVAAVLLQKQGYEVIGCTMKLWKPCGKSDTQMIEDAKKVCNQLGIEHNIIESTDIFKEKVVDNFIKEYKQARTPNPCVECNQYLKFGIFYEKAKEFDCDFIATGHYASISYSDVYKQHVLKKAKAEKKDQSYFLYTISKEKLENILFPLQEYVDKEKIRKIADEYKLPVAQKKESQEICFVPNDDYQNFLQENGYKSQKGNIVFKDGTILGEHQGYINYTVGQRKGLGISYKKPLYVIGLDKNKNEVIVGEEEDLYKKELKAKEMNWIVPVNKEPIVCKAKVRYRAKEESCVVYTEGEQVRIVFDIEQRAITPGQSVVLYDDTGVVLGGGKII